MKKFFLSLSLATFLHSQTIPSTFDDVGLKTISKESVGKKSKLVFQIKEPLSFINWLEQRVALGTFAQMAKKEEFLSEINGTKIAVEIDNEKFNSQKEDSVVVYLPEKGLDKVFRLYLTFDKNNYPIKGRLKDVDETIKDENSKQSLKILDTNFNCQIINSSKECDYRVGKFFISSKGDDNPGDFTVNSLNCKIASKDIYNFNQKCSLPTLSFVQNDSNLTTNLKVKNLNFNSNATVNSKNLLDSKNSLSVEKFTLFSKEDGIVDLNLSNTEASWSALNIKKSSIDLSNQLLKENLDEKESIKLLKKLLLSFTGDGANYNFDYKIKDIAIDIKDKNSTTNFSLGGFSSEYGLSFSKNISYKEHTKLDKLYLKDKNSLDLDLKSFEYAVSVDNLKNVLPELIEIFTEDINNSNLTKEQSEKLNKVVNSVVQNGVSIKISPISLEKLRVKSDLLNRDFGPDKIDINAILNKNSADISSQIGMMMLLGFIEVDSKVVLQKSDYEFLLKNIPPQFAGMISLFAKEQDGKVIFDIKFKNGQLLINGQKMM